MDIDLKCGWVRSTETEVQKILTFSICLLQSLSAPVRLLLSLLGLLNHASQLILLGRLYIRPLQLYVRAMVPNLAEAVKQSQSIPLEQSFQLSLQWWMNG